MIYKSGSPIRATFLQCKEKIMKFFQKRNQNQDQFKRLIHRRSEMSDSELTKVEQLLNVVFDSSFKSSERAEISRDIITDEEQSLDKSIQEAKNKLNTEQLEKRIEQFKQSKKPKNGQRTKYGALSVFYGIMKANMRRFLSMIGDNIKSLRQTQDLTQPEFAKMVGISRNSLSRYENGTSTVSTELIDRICQKFNVSYVDIVGEDKMLTPVEDYQLTLKVEVIKERGAAILSQLYRYQDSQNIAFDDESNPWILMSDDLAELIHTKIYLINTFDEIERYNGYLDGIERMLDMVHHRVVA